MSYFNSIAHPTYKRTSCRRDDLCGCYNNSHSCGCHDKCSCKDNSVKVNQTTINRKTIINNYNDPHKPIGFHNHHKEHCCESNYVSCGCGKNQVSTIQGLKPTLVCIETVDGEKFATIKDGFNGTAIVKFNGQYYSVLPNDKVAIVVTANETTNTCNIASLAINDTPVDQSNLFTKVIEEVHNGCPAPVLEDSKDFGIEPNTFSCNAFAEFFVLNEGC